MICPASNKLTPARDLTVAEIRAILGDEAIGMSDEQVLMIDSECSSFASMVCDLALGEPIKQRGQNEVAQ